MAHPKRKHSKARRDKRRANWKLKSPGFSLCSHCGKKKLPHHVCPHCGYYKDKPLVIIEEKEKKKKS